VTDKNAKDEYLIKNYMEDIVLRNIESQKTKNTKACWCARCEKDVFAFALNKLPAKYVVTDKGRMYTKLQEMETQLNADVTREVYKAIETVAANKRHS
jgi:competence protein ComFB